MSERKFYKYTISIEVVSEDALPLDCTLETVEKVISEGSCSGQVQKVQMEVINGQVMVFYLKQYQTPPDAFCLDEEGNDTDELAERGDSF